VNTRITNLSGDQIANGTSHKFIVNGQFNDDLTVNATLTALNLNITGDTTYINTTTYETENLQIVSQDIQAPALKIIQEATQNIVELYDTNTNVLVITKTGSIGIGVTEPEKKMDIDGGIKFSTDINGITSTELGYLHGVSSKIQDQLDAKQDNITGAATTILSVDLTSSMALVSDTNGKVAVHPTVASTELGYLHGVSSKIQDQLDAKQANITGAATTIISGDLTSSMALVSDTNGKVAVHPTVSSTELGYLDGVSSKIQDQLDAKQDNITGAATTIISGDLTASMALVSDTNGKVAVHPTVSSTELGYLDGVSSKIQDQLNAKQDNITGAATSITNDDLVPNLVLISNASGKVSESTITSTELGYLDGVSSKIQDQLNDKESSISLGTSQFVLINNTTGKVIVSSTPSSKLQYLNGVTSDIQDQINNISSGVSSQWSSDTGLIYYNSGTVGIGKSNPSTSYKLDITGDQYVAGNIYATGNVTASYSDIRLKDIVDHIEEPLDKIMKIRTFKYKPNEIARKFSISNNTEVGVSAQDVKDVLPEVVCLAPFDTSNLPTGEIVSKSGENYLTVSYERLVPLLIECIKNLNEKVDTLSSKFANI
jgi:hypothetical protein